MFSDYQCQYRDIKSSLYCSAYTGRDGLYRVSQCIEKLNAVFQLILLRPVLLLLFGLFCCCYTDWVACLMLFVLFTHGLNIHNCCNQSTFRFQIKLINFLRLSLGKSKSNWIYFRYGYHFTKQSSTLKVYCYMGISYNNVFVNHIIW